MRILIYIIFLIHNFKIHLYVVSDGEEAWNIGNGFGRQKGEEMTFFVSYLDYKAQNAQVSNALRNGNVACPRDIF